MLLRMLRVLLRILLLVGMRNWLWRLAALLSILVVLLLLSRIANNARTEQVDRCWRKLVDLRSILSECSWGRRLRRDLWKRGMTTLVRHIRNVAALMRKLWYRTCTVRGRRVRGQEGRTRRTRTAATSTDTTTGCLQLE